MSQSPIILWFRQDLRIDDNPALEWALESHKPIIPIYVLDDTNADTWSMGSTSRVWLYHALQNLNTSLGGTLSCYTGDALSLVPKLAKELQADTIIWNRCYEPWRITRDTKIKETLLNKGHDVKSFNGSLLWEPWDIKKQDGTHYKVFTPYFRKGCLQVAPPRAPLSYKHKKDCYQKASQSSEIDDLSLLPSISWHKTIENAWDISEKGAQNKLANFLENGLKDYKEGRNFPAKTHTSQLSPYLHFGQISPNYVWYQAQQAGIAHSCENDLDCFLSELGWREFSYSLLYHYPDLPENNLQKKFDSFPWEEPDNERLELWQKGQTGFPIVDAGMRELWATGTMHNRVRMITASFLIKDLLYHWHEGEKWFWDCLVDADLASNAASWQWVAGCGADAAPYFRIFNPLTQGEKFDPSGEYIRRWIPELSNIQGKAIHKPWTLDTAERKGYPDPMISHSEARDRALAAFKSLRSAA